MTELSQTKIAHLEIIQKTIIRMAGNSFSLKTLSVTLTTGLIALLGSVKNPTALYAVAILLPIFAFWLLDARYLQIERMYRRLYDDVRLGKIDEPFIMSTAQYIHQEKSILNIALSWSVLWVYATLITVLALIAVSLKINLL